MAIYLGLNVFLSLAITNSFIHRYEMTQIEVSWSFINLIKKFFAFWFTVSVSWQNYYLALHFGISWKGNFVSVIILPNFVSVMFLSPHPWTSLPRYQFRKSYDISDDIGCEYGWSSSINSSVISWKAKSINTSVFKWLICYCH